MKRKNLFVALGVSSLLAATTAGLFAAENIDTPADSDSIIANQLWIGAAFPFDWVLNEDGVINNDATGNGTPAVSNLDAVTELTAAFQAWENVPTSAITASYGGETTVSDIGCDQVNLVSWADTVIEPFFTDVIAIGFAFSYIGPDIVLNNVNRNIGCGPALSAVTYPNGTTLQSGTIVDADMIWNETQFDYVTTPNATPDVLDIRAIATHEFGHLFGVSHTSLSFSGTDPATMFPTVSATSISLQNNVRTLEADDEMASGRSYPDTGFFPGGGLPFTTGQITGRVRQTDGSAAAGVRLWAYDASSPFDPSAPPVYEAFSATAIDDEPGVGAGDYSFRGIPPGEYYICIVPWQNGVPDTQADDPDRYNATTTNGVGHIGFATECYDDAPSGSASPDFSEIDRLRVVEVTAGETTPNINFVTGQQQTDIMLVMDRSGSMGWALAAPPHASKLDALKYAADVFLDFMDLDGGHRVGLVQFEEVLQPFMPPFDLQPLNAGSIANAQAAVSGMSAGGWTNIIAGVNEGVSQLASIADPHDRQLMLLLTDGRHNRPLGSDLNDIAGPLLANEVTLYSVGFGTDLDDAILGPIAIDTGGLHVNNPDVTDMQLRKHFLSVASSAADSTALIDPHYDLLPGQTATLDVPVNTSERDLTFAVLWSEPDPDRFDITLTSPSGCRIYTKLNKPGVKVKKGATHRLVKVSLPYLCRFRRDLAGTWKVNVTSHRDHQRTRGVDIAVYGTSRTHVFADAAMSEGLPVLNAKVVAEGERVKEVDFVADIILPVPADGSSEKQDAEEKGRLKPLQPTAEERTITVRLFDDGGNGDRDKGDGIYTGLLPTELPGAYQVHLYARYKEDGRLSQRELLTSYNFDGREIITKKARK